MKNISVCMKLSVTVASLMLFAAGDLLTAAENVPQPEEDIAQAKGTKTLEVTVTPETPYLLPDGRTKIVVNKESMSMGRAGRTETVQVLLGDSALTIVPRTVIHVGGYRFEFMTPPRVEFGNVREKDMIFTIVKRCSLTVRSSRQEAPRVALKELDETIKMKCSHGRIYNDLYTIKGDGQQFLSLKPKTISISRFHPDPELGAKVQMDIINNAGVKSITLEYKKKKQVTLGHETVTLESSDFDYETKTMKVRVSTEPKTIKAAATILEYGATPFDYHPVQTDADKQLRLHPTSTE